MSDLADLTLPPAPPDPAADLLAQLSRTERRHRHVWIPDIASSAEPVLSSSGDLLGYSLEPGALYHCAQCYKPFSSVSTRRGRNNRKRGGAIQRQRIEGLGGRNLAGNNPNLDGLGEMFVYESKSGGSFPERLWRWLSAIPRRAGQIGVLIVTDAPGPGHRARSVVVVDYDDWRDLHQEVKP